VLDLIVCNSALLKIYIYIYIYYLQNLHHRLIVNEPW
jgi:hypothetical protein